MHPVTAVTPILAGEVRIKRTQRYGRGPVGVRHLRTMVSRQWLSPRPIYCWLIDHPDGPILVDTGPRPTSDWSYPRYHPFYPLAYRTRVNEQAGLLSGLGEADLSPDDLECIILTHCHPDHAEGLAEVPDVPVVMSADEYRYAGSLRGRFWGAHPSLTPERERARLVDLDDGSIGPFERSHEVVSGVSLVPTPGHTAHHCSVIIQGEGPPVMLAADAIYDVDQLDSGRADGVATRVRAGRRSVELVDLWHRSSDGVVLPSHDPAGPDRLASERRS